LLDPWQPGDTAAAGFCDWIGMRSVEVGEHFAVLEMRGGTRVGIRDDTEHIAPGPIGWHPMEEDLNATQTMRRPTGFR
jgi:hypothetical protein